ncbi:hypothetical protein EV130_112138 [Rhizobium azibense]|uniref:Uncharacterized protein n=1 Tax=Rhizobium azibense TaxID=1136135 RepID=A0A4R3RJ18_9HYPH|nr:hypothetical protein EV130_112138 [Rhizobium azibense]TCU35141.1 hypothetical protein EV129_110137 [Rhizobium azibense]
MWVGMLSKIGMPLRFSMAERMLLLYRTLPSDGLGGCER